MTHENIRYAMESIYKIRHWSPVKRVPKSCDGWWNVTEWEEVDCDNFNERT